MPPRCLRVKVTHRDNPYFPQELREEMEYDKEVDYEAYLNTWEGEPRAHSVAQIMSGKWQEGVFEITIV